MQFRSRLIFAFAASAALAGCAQHGELVVDEGVGITAIRTACPAVGIADYTGDMTLFRAPGAVNERNIDLSASMTNVRMDCDQAKEKLDSKRASKIKPGEQVHATVSFDVLARRADTQGARDVTVPFFLTVVRGGTAVIAKRVGDVTLHFADGQDRAVAHGEGTAAIDKAEATLSKEIRDRITRKRKAGEADAAVDPLAEPDVKEAVSRATFEVLVGFQLTDQQLAYNVTR